MSVQSSAHPGASVLGVVVHDDHLLLVRRINPPETGKWGYLGSAFQITVANAQVPCRRADLVLDYL
jgi:hypothetical protein